MNKSVNSFRFISLTAAALLLASTAAAQDKTSGAPDAATLLIPKQIPLAGSLSEKTDAPQGALIDFTKPRLMNPVGLIPEPVRGVGVASPVNNPTTSGALHITLGEAQARAIANKAIVLAQFNIDATRYHRQAAQADYFPKATSFFANLHYNKFMGETIQVVPRRLPIPPFTRAVPLLNKDETIVTATVTQPITPLFKVHQVVRIARADERIAEARMTALTAQVITEVEQAFFAVLIAQRRQTEAEARVEIAERQVEIASLGGAPPAGMTERQSALLEAKQALISSTARVRELTNSLNDLTGLPVDTRLDLAEAPPIVEPVTRAQKPQPVIAYSPEIVEAEENVVKARAAHRLAKLEYLPDVAIFGSYIYQTAIPLLPNDFSLIGVVGTFTLFDFGKRERTIKERGAQVSMAKANLELVRAKAAAGAQKTVMDLDRTRRIFELTRQVAAMSRATMSRNLATDPESRAALAKAEAEMFQADLDYRSAIAQKKRVENEQ